MNKNESPDKNKTRVLIVDDEYQICSSIAGVLDYLGYRSDFVHDPAGLQEFLDKNNDVDIVLLDINLGQNISGIDLLPVIREKSKYTQVIMFTSEDRLEVGVECMQRGAYDYMTKPFMEQTFINKAAGALERKKNLKLNDLYLGILFHDLKTPLQGIVSGVDFLRMLLAETGITETMEKALHATERATSQILLMINNVVSVSKFENGAYSLQIQPFILQKEAEKTLSLFNISPAGDEKPPYSMRFFSNDDITLVSDRNLFCHVLANIVNNALRHAVKKSTITVEFLKAEDNRIQVSVTNTGSFIDIAARETIFNKFSSVEPAAGQGGFQNFGLGLTFSKMAVEAMGGRIWITSDKAPASTTFHFTVKNFSV